MASVMTPQEWEQLSDLLVKVADLDLPTWREKREEMLKNLTQQGHAAAEEIIAWFDTK